MVQWLRLPTPNAEGTGLSPGRGAPILHTTLHGLKHVFLKIEDGKEGIRGQIKLLLS